MARNQTKAEKSRHCHWKIQQTRCLHHSTRDAKLDPLTIVEKVQILNKMEEMKWKQKQTADTRTWAMVVMSVKSVQHKEACETLKATKIMDLYNKPGMHKPNSNSQHSCASQTPPVDMRVDEDVKMQDQHGDGR